MQNFLTALTDLPFLRKIFIKITPTILPTIILGGKWRIPTAAEWQELIDKCTWVPRDVNSYYCYYEVVVTGPNGNSITLRAEGEYQDRILFNTVGYYWSSEVDTVYPFRAKKLVFSRDTAFISVGNRNIGLNIRPVMD